MELSMEQNSDSYEINKLNDEWTLWAHLPHDIDWKLSSYKKIITIKSVQDILALYHYLPDIMIKNCMLFLMRKNINPIWEDQKNKNGGCFSYKINNKIIISCWKNLSYLLLGETLCESSIAEHVNGITISPKKNFCIIKIWMTNCDYQNPDIIRELEGIIKHGCLFKKHIVNE